MLHDRLQDLSGRIADARALALVAADGILVETVGEDSPLDLEVTAAELTNQLKQMSANERGMSLAAVRELSIVTASYSIIMSALSREHYLLLVLGEGGTHGRARFELRRAALLLAEELA